MDYPIVFIPGILSSMGNEIIPGTGNLGFGLAEPVYRPMLDNLKSLGYKLDEDLYVCFYDWKKENQYSVQQYLIPMIEKVKKQTKKKKVNLLCHSMGGLMARAYIQGNSYKYDVDKLIMLGTPNHGSVSSYFFWEGGQLPYERVNKNIFFRLLWEGFVWILKNIKGMKSDLITLREMFPSIKQLMPSYEYGNYLYSKDEDGVNRFIPINRMKVQNDFLNNLNKSASLIHMRGVNAYSIIGEGNKTEMYIGVDRKKTDSMLWEDGIPKYVSNTYKGDGTVTTKSCAGVFERNYYINESHTGILENSKEVLGKILNREVVQYRDIRYMEENENLNMILVKGIAELYIHKGRKRLKVNGDIRTYDDRLIIKKIDENSYWMVYDPEYLARTIIRIIPLSETKGKLIILRGNEDSNHEEKTEIEIEETYILSIR
ncbi:MAG: alpha/beta hydrolase [Firmicutes bacterium]|nr:alpha/beta hydrolase [Bacillota bacterium]